MKSYLKGDIEIIETSEGIFSATSKKSRYKIVYDRNKCIGAASCSALAPMTFIMDEENKAIFNQDSEEFDKDDDILAGAQSCPVFAIKIYDKISGELIFPEVELD